MLISKPRARKFTRKHSQLGKFYKLIDEIIDSTPKQYSLDSKEHRELSLKTLLCSLSKESLTRRMQAFTSARELLTSIRQRMPVITQDSESCGEESSKLTATPELLEQSSQRIFQLRPWEQLLESCFTPTELFEP